MAVPWSDDVARSGVATSIALTRGAISRRVDRTLPVDLVRPYMLAAECKRRSRRHTWTTRPQRVNGIGLQVLVHGLHMLVLRLYYRACDWLGNLVVNISPVAVAVKNVMVRWDALASGPLAK